MALTATAVNSSGAVSPAPRATASSEPVISPGSAVGSTTRKTTASAARRARAPPRAASRARGSSTTSAERVTTGSISSASATEPFQPANAAADAA